jgi:hypothetical protein
MDVEQFAAIGHFGKLPVAIPVRLVRIFVPLSQARRRGNAVLICPAEI